MRDTNDKILLIFPTSGKICDEGHHSCVAVAHPARLCAIESLDTSIFTHLTTDVHTVSH